MQIRSKYSGAVGVRLLGHRPEAKARSRGFVMAFLILALVSFAWGLLVGRWWAGIAALAVGLWISQVSELEVGGWFVGLAFSGVALLFIGLGVAIRHARREKF